MSLTEHKERLQNTLDEHLESPIPILTKLRKWILGNEKPDSYTQISFYIGLAIWTLLFSWILLGYTVISNTNWIENEKGIPVNEIMIRLGANYGFSDELFINRLVNFHHLAIISWIIILIGLVLQWRKSLYFIYLIIAGSFLYLIGMWSMLSFSYWYNEITLFDKSIFFILIFHSLIHYYFIYKESKGEKINLFGVEDE